MREHETDAIEVRGEDVETAIVAGLRRLGLGRDEVIIAVEDEGRRGFLGIGGREAVVRLTPVVRPSSGRPPAVAEEAIPGEAPAGAAAAGPDIESIMPPPGSPETAPASPAASEETVTPAKPEPDEQELAAVEIVQGLLRHMQIAASVSTRYTEPDDMTGKRLLVLDVQGDDLGELIGPRGEVLSDFQYVARLMAGHRLNQRADFLVDVDGYRQRRQDALAKLARRMAGKAVKRGRPVTLEPMSPYDRRIIHLTLRGDESVYTESTGQGNQRRVRIFPK